jgi:hypothetical protein
MPTRLAASALFNVEVTVAGIFPYATIFFDRAGYLIQTFPVDIN